jgi:hypothetical protein
LAIVFAMPTTPCLVRGRHHDRVPHSGQVGVQRVLPDRGRYLVPALHGADAGVGADDVELAKLRDAVVNGGPQRAGVAHVGGDGDDPAVELLDGLDRLAQVGVGGHAVANRRVVTADVDRDDVGALFGQPHRMAAALTPRRSGDERDLPCYTPWHVRSSSRCDLS